jgi:hypothetical protein
MEKRISIMIGRGKSGIFPHYGGPKFAKKFG